MWIAAISLGGLGLVLSIALVLAYTKLAIKRPPLFDELLESLPGANCGGCGYSGCEAYATALLEKKVSIGLCPVGGKELADKLAQLLRMEPVNVEPQVAVIKCVGDKANTYERFKYIGIMGCTASDILAKGAKSCIYGCLGLGDCVRACKFDAINMGDNGLPVIDDKKCTGCGNCVEVCPRKVIQLIPKIQKIYVACLSPESAKVTKANCKTGCIGCGLCAKNCPYNGVKVEGGNAYIIFEQCQNCAICVYKCPTGAIVDKLKARPKAMIGTNCTGCEKCKPVCPMKAIEGEKGKQHKVNLNKCIGCGLCYKICEPEAITMAFSLGYTEVNM